MVGFVVGVGGSWLGFVWRLVDHSWVCWGRWCIMVGFAGVLVDHDRLLWGFWLGCWCIVDCLLWIHVCIFGGWVRSCYAWKLSDVFHLDKSNFNVVKQERFRSCSIRTNQLYAFHSQQKKFNLARQKTISILFYSPIFCISGKHLQSRKKN